MKGRPAAFALMATGAVLVAFAVFWAWPRSDDGGSRASRGVPAGSPTPSCRVTDCQANGDRRPVRGYAAPSVAVNPANPDHIVVADHNAVGGVCSWHVTFNAGRDWQDGAFQIPDGYKPCRLDSSGQLPMGNVAFGPSGTAYVVISSAGGWNGTEAGEPESVLVATSADGGRTFSPARVATKPTSELAFVRPSVTVVGPDTPGGPDRLLVSFWGCARGGCNQALFSSSLDGGQTFTPAVRVSPDPGGNTPSAPVLGKDGRVHVMYLRRYRDNQADLVLASSSDMGKTFTTKDLDRQFQLGERYDPAKLVVDPVRGHLYTVFSDRSTAVAEVYFRRSTDNGQTWGETTRLNRRERTFSYSPAMSVSPEGRIDVVFYQRRVEGREEVHHLFSTDGGATFSPDRLVSGQLIDRRYGYGEEVGDWYTPGVMSSSRTSTVVWTDTRNGNPQNDNQDTFMHIIDVVAQLNGRR